MAASLHLTWSKTNWQRNENENENEWWICQKLFCCKLSPSLFSSSRPRFWSVEQNSERCALLVFPAFDSTKKSESEACLHSMLYFNKKKSLNDWVQLVSVLFMSQQHFTYTPQKYLFDFCCSHRRRFCCRRRASIGKPIDRNARPFGERCNFNAFIPFRCIPQCASFIYLHLQFIKCFDVAVVVVAVAAFWLKWI